jgi:hypothetical protein
MNLGAPDKNTGTTLQTTVAGIIEQGAGYPLLARIVFRFSTAM